MTTKLTKAVARLSDARAPYKASGWRPIVVGLHPNDTITLRLKGTRFTLTLDIRETYYHALKLHAAQVRAERKAARKR